jgi:autotransporter-associated beta strand protein
MPRPPARRAAALAALALAFLPAAARGQYVWTGAGPDGNWGTAANWNSGVPVPGLNTSLTFAGTANLSAADNLAAGFQLNSLVFAPGSGAFNLSGASLNFVNSGSAVGPTITQNSTTAITIGNALSLSNTLTFSGVGNATLSGVISGAGGLTVSGSGTLTLTAADTYTGATAVTAGTLALAGAAGTAQGTSGFAVGRGGTLTLDSTAGANADRVGDATAVTLTGGTFKLLGQAGGLTQEQVGALTFGSAAAGGGLSTVTVTVGNASGSAVLNPTALTRTGRATVLFTGTNLGVNPAQSSNTGSVTFRTTAPVGLGLGGATGSVTQSVLPYAVGDAGLGVNLVSYQTGLGVHPLNANTEYYTSGLATAAAGYNVRQTAGFGGTNPASINSLTLDTSAITVSLGTALTLTSGVILVRPAASGATLSGAAVSFNAVEGVIHAYGNLTVASQLTGTAGLTVSGTGTVTFPPGSNNPFSGGLVVNGAAVNANNTDAALGAAGGAVTLDAGTLLGGLTSGRPVTLGSGGGTFDTSGSAQSLSGAVSGPGGLTKAGAGTLTLSNAGNGYQGGTTVTSGVLAVAADGGLGAAAGRLTLNAGSTLQLTGAVTTARAVTLGGAATVQADADAALAGVVSGPGSLSKTGAAVLALAAGNTYAGGTTLTAGTLAVADDTALGAAGGGLTFAGGTLRVPAGYTNTRPVTFNGGGFDVTSGTHTVSQVLAAGALTKLGAGTLVPGGANTYAGGTTVAAGTLQVGADANLGAAAGGLTFSGGTLQLTAGLTTARAVTVTTAGVIDTNGFAATFSGAVSGAGALTKAGAGTLTAGGAVGPAAVAVTGGTLQLGAGGSLTAAVSLSAGTALDLNGVNASVAALTGTGAVTLGGATLTVANAAAATFGGTVSGAGGLTAAGPGVFTAAGSNSYTGPTAVTGGTLRVGSAAALPAGSALSVASGATLDLNGFDTTAAGLAGTGTLALGAAVVTFNTPVGTTVAAGITGTGGLTKAGAGDLTLTGPLAYTGPTTVAAGRLVVSSLGGTSGFAVNSGGTLQLAAGGYALGFGSLAPAAGGTVEYNGSAVTGGFLYGPGTHALLAGASFTGTTTFNSAVLAQTGAATLTSFTNGGTLASTAALTWNGGVNQAGGAVTVSGTAAVSNLTSYGTVTVSPGGVVNNTVSDLVLGGGSRTFVGAVGAGSPARIDLGGRNLVVAGGLLVNNGGALAGGGGIVNGTVVVDFGGKAKGVGYYEAVTTQNGGVFSPGNSPGTTPVGTFAVGPGSVLNIDVNAAGPNGNPAGGTSGTNPGWGRVDVSGVFRVTATAAQPASLTLTSLTLANAPGPVSNFDPSVPHKWEVVRLQPGAVFTTDPTGTTPAAPAAFDPAAVPVLTAGTFQNSLAGGSFLTTYEPNGGGTYSVFVNYTPVPEPAAGGLVAAAAGLAGLLRRRRAHKAG